MRVAIVGAGIAGLACARTLHKQGTSVTLFDKGRAAGGRVATRRAESIRFDHGAQFFTARDDRFLRLVEDLVERGLVSLWEGPFSTLRDGQRNPDPRPAAKRFVGVPGMSAVPRALAEGLDVHNGTQIVALHAHGEHGWMLTASGGYQEPAVTLGGQFDEVILAMPPKQANELLVRSGVASAVLRATADLRQALRPCLCAMLVCAEPIPGALGGMFIAGDDVISWAAHDGGKPARGGSFSYVLHGTAAWSEQNFQIDPLESARELASAFGRVAGVSLPEITHLAGHRWGFALSNSDPRGPAFGRDRERGLSLVGDALAGGRVEGAFLSGVELAETMLAE